MPGNRHPYRDAHRFCRGFILHTSMLPSRRYIPADSDVIYHYCSPESFLAICTTRRLRFSDLFSMNDFMEMHWGYHIWERAAGALLDTVGKALLDDIDAILHASGARGLALASCLSRAGDVLSQWRAYAHDGTGYAIGFKATAITQLAVRPLQVQYDTEQQIAEIKAFIAALHEIESTEKEPRGQEFFKVCAHLAFDLAALKNPAFAEENEVRLVHVVNFRPSNGSMQLVDPGGTAFGKPVAPQPVGFHISHSVPVAHIDLDFTGAGTVNPICEVVLGPRNEALPSGVSVFLETLAIPNVNMRKSTASYR